MGLGINNYNYDGGGMPIPEGCLCGPTEVPPAGVGLGEYI